MDIAYVSLQFYTFFFFLNALGRLTQCAAVAIFASLQNSVLGLGVSEQSFV
jgi:hypothetical protein